jgi:hypothetical protein
MVNLKVNVSSTSNIESDVGYHTSYIDCLSVQALRDG